MKLAISDPQLFANTLEALSVIVDEATFMVDENGLRLRSMDPQRVAMVDFTWSKSMFEEFTVESSEAVKLCFNLPEMLKIVKRAGKEDKLELSRPQEKGKMAVLIVGKSSRAFTLMTLDPAEAEVPLPKIDFNAKAKLAAETMSSVLEDAQLASDHVTIEAAPEKLTFTAKGDLLMATMILEKNSQPLLDLEMRDAQKALFSLSTFSDILKKAIRVSDIVTLEFSSDMPLKLSFTQKQPEAQLTYYLAPRIDSSD